MKQTDLAWAAGVIDGEGCIYSRINKSGIYPYLDSRVAVRMNHKPTIYKLWKLFGVGSFNKEKAKDGYRCSWSWVVSGRPSVISILTKVQPFLITKKDECIIILSLLKHKSSGTHRGPGHKVPQNIWRLREEVSRKLSLLKRRGWE